MIVLQYSKTTGKHTHEDKETGVRTEVTTLPPQASMKAVKARAKAMGLRVEKGGV